MASKASPLALRLRADLRDAVDAALAEHNAALTAAGEKPTTRNGWIVKAIEMRLGIDRLAADLATLPVPPELDPSAPPARAARTAKPRSMPGPQPAAGVEYLIEHRQVTSVWQWRQVGQTKPHVAASVLAIKDDARNAIRGAGERRPFIIRLVTWSPDA